jgi:amino acid adenylation domain-containing protein/non-ribosomal peptide synthase protein (TIGR01720 family)
MPEIAPPSMRSAALTGEPGKSLERRLRGALTKPAQDAVIPRRQTCERAPLSYAQEALWFLQQLHPTSAVYTETWAVRITGPIKAAVLDHSLVEIVRRHEILRTCFPMEDGKPVQAISPVAEVRLRLMELGSLTADEREVEVDRLATAESEYTFDLEHGPLLRTALLRFAEEDAVFVFSMHHIICDGMSAGIFLREIQSVYAAYAMDQPSPLLELPIQFGDYAAWERQQFDERAEENLRYWTESQPNLATCELSLDRPRPPVQSFRGASESVRLPDSIAAALNSFAVHENASLFMTLLATFQILLHRYCGQTHIVVGSPIADRPGGSSQDLIGLYVNTVLFRTDLSGNPTAKEALALVRESALEALAHRQTPFDRLVDALNPERDLSRNPLFQIAFAFEPQASKATVSSTLKWQPLSGNRTTAKFDLTMIVEEGGDGFTVVVEYCTDLFEAPFIRQLIRHYQSLLEAISSCPETRISELPMLTESELHQLLVEWNGAQSAYPSNSLLHELFRQRALHAPEAIAVEHGDNQITYAEIERRSNKLGRYLTTVDLTPEVTAGVSLDRSVETVIAILGILKAGGVYIPIDPGLPDERRGFLLSDARASVLITTRFDTVPSGYKGAVVYIDEWDRIEESGREASEAEVAVDSLACVLYTSGSTGVPKGVGITHRGICRMIFDPATVKPGPSDRWSQVSPFAFDASTFEIWGALLNGARLVILSRDVVLSIDALKAEIHRQQFSVMFLTTALFHQIARQDPSMLSGVRTLLVGGETANPRAFRKVLEAGPPERLLHMYGPAEAVTFASRFVVETVSEQATSISIGRPVSNLRLHILDDHLNLSPVGVPGELCVAGDCYARGYLHRPDITAERFVPDEQSVAPGGRMYRTGDRARYLLDGNIEFLGRLDTQVKLRGFRIELGEIESALLSHPAVGQAAVALRQGEEDRQDLVAYVSPARDVLPDTMELRRFLQAKLPEYMVPSVIAILAELPCNPNGKVDRRALPALERGAPGNDCEYVAPRTAVEKLLARIWAEVLDLPQIGIHNNFFAAGGDSILSIQIVARASQAGLRVTPQALFQNQTIAALASVCERGPREPIPTLMGRTPLTPIQRWFFEGCSADLQHFNQALCLELTERVNPAWIETALDWIALHHEALRFRFEKQSSGWTQTAGAEGAWPLERIDLSGLSPAQQDVAYLEHANRIERSLDLFGGPLALAALFDLGAARPGRLLMVAHHLVVDSVSWRIILEDLEVACLSTRRGEPLPPPNKTTGFQTWARRLEQYADSPQLRNELPHWLSLDGGNQRLPIDHDRGENDQATARTITFSLTAAETESLLRDVPKAYRTQINDALLTALLITINHWTGQRDLLLDLEGHGRQPLFDDLDLSRSVGWFTSLFPVYLQFDGTSPGETLLAVKERLRSIPGRGVGFGLLCYMCSDAEVSARLRALPHPEISFNYLGQMRGTLAGSRLFRLTGQDTGAQSSPRQRRRHKLEVDAKVLGGRLQFDWTYSTNQYRQETIERLGKDMNEVLCAIIRFCTAPDAGGLTTSDFPLARLDRTAFDRLWRLDRFIEDIYPLSPLQKGMLFHTFYAPRSGVYFEQLQLELEGDVAPEALRQAWDQVTIRHPILRTSFFWELEDPVQVVRKPTPVYIEDHDWRDLETADRQDRLEAFLRSDRDQGFDLFQAPPMRLALFRTAEGKHQLVWSFHHALLDGWSMSLVIREVFVAYEAFRLGQEPPLGPPRPWRDYLVWLSKLDQTAEEAFWREYLRGFIAPTPLPLAKPFRQSELETYDEVETHLPEDITAALNTLTRRQHLTLSSVLQGAWALLLSRYTGERDVLFGATVSGRPAGLNGIESMVGMFLNTLPVRLSVPPSISVMSWLNETQEQLAALRQHQHSSLVDVQGWSDVPRDAPLFESIFIVENYPIDPVLRGIGQSLRIASVKMHEQTTYPLSVFAVPGKELRLSAVFDRRRYDPDMLYRILGHFRVLLEDIASQPDRLISELNFLTADERGQLLAWGSSKREPRELVCAHEYFEAQVERTPQAVAVEYGRETLTYCELNRRANQLAWRLKSLGVGPDMRVGLCVEHSPAMVISVLAVLKAGGAFVPLDPRYPLKRLSFMLEDGQIPVLVTEGALLDSIPAHSAPIVRLDADREHYEKENANNPPCGFAAANLAYVIYTSGSTGEPKGVLLNHGGLSNLVAAQVEAFDCDTRSRVLQFASLNFDASVSEILVTLASGGTLVLASQDDLAPGEPLAKCLRHRSISLATLPPTVLQTIPLEATFPDLKTLVSAGEACPSELYKQWSKGRRFLNAYGPTETTVCATIEAVADPAPHSIGRPITGAQIYILDSDLRMQPAGVTGELYIGGAGLARGYLNRPELTAAAFLPNPFSEEPGDRIYRTGDLGHWLGEGSIAFVGRNDQQVKLRGFRIELGEVETALIQQPGVSEAAVVVLRGSGGNSRMVAYLVPEGSLTALGPALSVQEVRATLSRTLPGYMIPSEFVLIEEMPRNSSGKLDRKSLPAPDSMRVPPKLPATSARNLVEEIMCGIWDDVLAREHTGVEDNFFEVGGHSLIATKVILRVREAFQIDLPLRVLFEHPTPSALARFIEAEEGSTALCLTQPIQRTPRTGELELSFAQQSLWFVQELAAGASNYNCPFALDLRGPLRRGALERTLDEIVRRHEVLRTRFPAVDGSPVQIIEPMTGLTLVDIDPEVIPLQRRAGGVAGLMAEEFERPFDLKNGPVIRATLVRQSEHRHTLLLAMHHIICDAWSLGVLLHEITELYDAFSQGRPPKLDDPPIQYADFAAWQRSWVKGGQFQTELDYWSGTLKGCSTVMGLPFDRPRPLIPTYAGACLTTVLPDELARRVREVSRRHGATLFMTLLAGFQAFLHRLSGQDEINVGVASAGRNRVEIEGLVGLFLNMLVLRADLSGNLRFFELLAQVREAVFGAFAHQNLPFEKLVEEFQPDRSQGAAPLFQVAFGIDRPPQSSVKTGELEITLLEPEVTTARYDLTLWISERPDRLEASWTYSKDLFNAGTIEGLQRRFEALLASAVLKPEARIGDLEWRTATEIERDAVEQQSCEALKHRKLLNATPKAIRAGTDFSA